MIWKINNSQVYLLGSVHLMKNEANSHLISIDDVYKDVTTVVFEHTLDAEQNRLCFYEDDKLSNNISRSLFRDVKNKWLKYRMDYSLLEKSKIWSATNSIAINILGNAGFSSEYGIDRLLWDRSRNDNKKIEWLESLDEVYSCFDTAPVDEQKHNLAKTVRDKNEVISP
jgi:uncharacterized protein YbaP (TraB family)